MLLYYLFWMFMDFTKHFYIISGTNLLTGGPAQIVVFLPISVFRRKGISNGVQTESKRNGTFGRVIFGTEAIQETWSRRQGSFKEATRVQGAPYPLGAPTLVGPLWLPRPTSFTYIYPYTLKTSESAIDWEFHPRKPL